MRAVKDVPTSRDFTRVLAELERREGEGLSVYRGRREQMPFHLSLALERLAKGGNRSGKTVCCAAEVASAALGQPLIGPDGEPIPHKYPSPPLVIWLIGFDERHIARIGRKLFKPGLFRCVKDPVTGRARIWKGYVEEPELETQTFASPPLIPKRMIKTWAWENKAKGVFSSCELTNGTMFYAFPSGTEAAIGDAVDVIWVDEDVTNPEIIPELQARTADVRGRFIWSSWPRVSNNALTKMHKAAEEEADSENPDVFEINLKFSDNPYIPPEARARIIRRWKHQGRAVWQARDLGEFITDNVLVFPSFDHRIHTLPAEKPQGDPLEQWLAEHDWQVPGDWTWYLGIDPGHTKLAAIPLVIPPPWLGDFAVVPGEVFLEIADADDLISVVADRWPHVRWEAFVIDFRGSRVVSGGTSTKVIEHYEAACEKHNLRCRQTDHHIIYGLDDPTERNMTIREWLTPREDKSIKLRLIAEDTEQLQAEFGLYKKKVTKSDVHEEVVRRDNDCIDALGYIVSYEPVWVDDREDDRWEPEKATDRVIRTWEQTFNRNAAPDGVICMGPGAASQAQSPI